MTLLSFLLKRTVKFILSEIYVNKFLHTDSRKIKAEKEFADLMQMRSITRLHL